MANDNLDNLEQDVTLSRLLDGRGRAADWKRLKEAMGSNPALWDQLIGDAADQDALGDAVALAGMRAEATVLPDAATLQAPLPFEQTQSTSGRRHDRAVRAARLGWLVAACLALGMVSMWVRPQSANIGSQGAGIVSFDKMSASDLMEGYKARATREGTLVAEMPQRVVLETRPTADGKGHEVLYMRQFIERAIVDDLYKIGTDDAGRSVMVPASLSTTKPAGAM